MLACRLDKAIDITTLCLSILFIVWFRRARINAELHDYPQRRARGWAVWGWIIPIVDLWFPFQIMGIPIIRTVSSGPVGSPPQPVYVVR